MDWEPSSEMLIRPKEDCGYFDGRRGHCLSVGLTSWNTHPRTFPRAHARTHPSTHPHTHTCLLLGVLKYTLPPNQKLLYKQFSLLRRQKLFYFQSFSATLTSSNSRSIFLSLSLSRSPSLPPSLPLSLLPSLSPSFSHSLSHSQSLSQSRSLTHKKTQYKNTRTHPQNHCDPHFQL